MVKLDMTEITPKSVGHKTSFLLILVCLCSSFLCWPQSADFDKKYANKITFDPSFWPNKIRFKNGKVMTPFEREGNRIYFADDKGKTSLKYYEAADFKKLALKRLRLLTDFELHVTYDNLFEYRAYFPKKLKVRFVHEPLKDNTYHKMKHRLFRLKGDEGLDVVNVTANQLLVTNERIRSVGLSSVPIDPFYTDILYRVRGIIREKIDEAVGNYIEPMVYKDIKGRVSWIYEVDSNLTEIRTTVYGHAPVAPFNHHFKGKVENIDVALPLPLDIDESDLEDAHEKINFQTAYYFLSDTHKADSVATLGDLKVLKFYNRHFYRKSLYQPLSMNPKKKPSNKIVFPHDWEAYVNISDDWDIVYFRSNIKGVFKRMPNNVLRFFSKDVVEDMSYIEIRLRNKTSGNRDDNQSEENIDSIVANTLTEKGIPQKRITKKIKNLSRDFVEGFITNFKDQIFNISDWSENDGDIISIILNDEIIYDKVKVTNEPKELEFMLEKGENVLEVKAENEGSNPPNTARFEYGDKIVKLDSKKGESKKIKFIFNSNLDK